LETEQLEELQIEFESGAVSFAFSFPNDEIVFLANSNTYTFLVETKDFFQIAEGNDMSLDGYTMPFGYRGVWYFLGVIDGTKRLFSIDESSKDITQVGEFEE